MKFIKTRFTFTIPKSWKTAFLKWIRICRKVFFLVVPHLSAVAILIIYLLLGSFVFCSIEGWDTNSTIAFEKVYNISSLETELRNDTASVWFEDHSNDTVDLISRVKRGTDLVEVSVPKPKRKKSSRVLEWNMFDGVLFAYSTVTTIGYSDLTPTTNEGRFFYILYAMIGVPICTIVLVDWALYIEEFSHYLIRVTGFGQRLFRYDTRRYTAIGAELIILLPLAILFFVFYVFLGALLLRLWENGWTFADGFYAAFDAVTTIGIGDIRPANHHYYPLTLIYVTVGIAVASTCLTLAVSDMARMIHYGGRDVADCASKTVYFGSRRVRVCQLLEMAGKEWGVENGIVQDLIGKRLDVLVNEAFERRESEPQAEAQRIRNNLMESSL